MRWDLALLASVYSLTLLPIVIRFAGPRIRKLLLSKSQELFYNACMALPIADGVYKKKAGGGSYSGAYDSRHVMIEYGDDNELTIQFVVVEDFQLQLLASKPGQWESNHPEAARDFLQNVHVQEEFGRLSSDARVTIKARTLRCETSGSFRATEARTAVARPGLRELVDSLSRLAHYYDVQSRSLRVWTAVPSIFQCAYCREDLPAADVGIHRCPKCGARMHRECYQEYGRCTTYGCSPTRSDNA